MTTYAVIKPLIVVRDELGGQHMFYDGTEFSDEGLDAEHVKMLVKEEFIEKVKGGKSAPADSGDSKPTTVPGILAAVGTDKALAQQYLDEEKAAATPRTTLVEPLQAIVDAE